MTTTEKQSVVTDDEKRYATINDLPEEMLEHYCTYASIDSMKAPCLTCREICQWLQRSYCVFLEVKHIHESTAKCKSLLSCEHLEDCITSLVIHTSPSPATHSDDNCNVPDYEECRREIDLLGHLESVLLRLGTFNDLGAVILDFAMAFAGVEDDFDNAPEIWIFQNWPLLLSVGSCSSTLGSSTGLLDTTRLLRSLSLQNARL